MSMASNDFPLLNTPHLVVVILKCASAYEVSTDDALRYLRKVLKVAGEQPPLEDDVLRQRLDAVARQLVEAGLLTSTEGGGFRITEAGSRAIARRPAGFDTADLTEPRRRDSAASPGRVQSRGQRDAPYQEGYAAFLRDTPISGNPHHQDTIDHRAWEDGWSEARDDAASNPFPRPQTGWTQR